MNDNESSDLAKFRAKLETLESSLRKLVGNMENDLEVARGLQRLLHPNRLPEIPGLRCLARYISAQQLSAEGFDIIPTQAGKEAWFVASWTETFGLSSLLLQAMVRIQSQALVAARPHVSPSEIFNELALALTAAKRGGGFRLMVAKLDTLTLRMSGVSIGCAPWLRRHADKSWEWVSHETMESNPSLILAPRSEAPVLAEDAFNFSIQIAPGSRLYYLSSSWAEPSSLAQMAAPLDLELAPRSMELADDLNHLLIKAGERLEADAREADLLGIAVEVDARKLHLA